MALVLSVPVSIAHITSTSLGNSFWSATWRAAAHVKIVLGAGWLFFSEAGAFHSDAVVFFNSLFAHSLFFLVFEELFVQADLLEIDLQIAKCVENVVELRDFALQFAGKSKSTCKRMGQNWYQDHL